MSGTPDEQSERSMNRLDLLERVLDRNHPVATLQALRAALAGRSVEAKRGRSLSSLAFGLDTNILLRIGKADHKTTDLFDYLVTSHQGPLILPGQVVQEFWNNTISVVDTVAKSLKKRFDDLQRDIARTGMHDDFEQRFRDLLSEYEEHYGFIYDPRTVEKFAEFFEMLESKARVAYVPRSRFERLVSMRSSTKTPPGFKDDGDGDFFVWADFLLGLLESRAAGAEFTGVVLITEDTKADWSSGGSAHPILVAEVAALLEVPLETWTLEKFNRSLGEADLNSVGDED